MRRTVAKGCSVWRCGPGREVSRIILVGLERGYTVVGRASKRSVEW